MQKLKDLISQADPMPRIRRKKEKYDFTSEFWKLKITNSDALKSYRKGEYSKWDKHMVHNPDLDMLKLSVPSEVIGWLVRLYFNHNIPLKDVQVLEYESDSKGKEKLLDKESGQSVIKRLGTKLARDSVTKDRVKWIIKNPKPSGTLP